MFSKHLLLSGHVRSFVVNRLGGDGWEVREEQDQHVIKQVLYTDWHRVERAMGIFRLEIGELESQGWVAAA